MGLPNPFIRFVKPFHVVGQIKKVLHGKLGDLLKNELSAFMPRKPLYNEEAA